MVVTVVDYGMGNLRSVLHKIQKITPHVVLSSEPAIVEKADKLILPGVGSFAAGMRNLRERGLLEVLDQKVNDDKTPILGICLGMQLFSRHSEEGDADGLGWIDAKTIRLQPSGCRVPHVGWNTIHRMKESPILKGLPDDYRFYFTHSYHVVCNSPNDILATTRYSIEFTSMIQTGNMVGVQFHPEKSHIDGVRVIRNFIEEM